MPLPSNDELLELVCGDDNLVHVCLSLGQPGMVEALLCCESFSGKVENNKMRSLGHLMLQVLTWSVIPAC